MSYKKFVFLLFVSIFSLFLALLLFPIFLHEYYPKDSLKNKEYLLEKNPKLIFAGDSRSERQLIPKIASSILKIIESDVINIGTSAGDPVMIDYLIDKHPNKFKNSIIIISISPNTLNENTKVDGYFSHAMISHMDIYTQAKIFFPKHMKTLLSYYLHIIKGNIKTFLGISNNLYTNSNGFHGIIGEGILPNNVIEILNKSPFYKNYSDGGIKYQLTEEALVSIKKKVKKLIVFTAPFSPNYIRKIKNHNLFQSELKFKNSIQKICNKNEIEYKNYLLIEVLSNDCFYDFAHTNEKGAVIFTKIILKDFNLVIN